MTKRGNHGKQVTISISLPQELYDWIEYAAQQKGITVSKHIADWITRSLEPWEWDEPLPLNAHSVIEYEGTPAGGTADVTPHEPQEPAIRREDFDSLEAYLEAVKRDRIARGLATRKRNREAQPKVLPDHIKRIAEARVQHPDLSLRQFSQLLYDQDIYRSNAWDRNKACPVNSATLSVWLRQAREAGVLPKKAMPHRAPRIQTVSYPRARKA